MAEKEAKDTKGKLRLSLVPPQAEIEIAKVREFGTEKYTDPDNWKEVANKDWFDGVLRHISKMREKGLDALDKESNLLHASHALCGLAFIVENLAKKKEEAKQEVVSNTTLIDKNSNACPILIANLLPRSFKDQHYQATDMKELVNICQLKSFKPSETIIFQDFIVHSFILEVISLPQHIKRQGFIYLGDIHGHSISVASLIDIQKQIENDNAYLYTNKPTQKFWLLGIKNTDRACGNTMKAINTINRVIQDS